jgi:hypothetical protein
MPFIKHGDGKIVAVIEEDELTDQQKKAVKNSSLEQVKISEEKSSTNKKVSGDN